MRRALTLSLLLAGCFEVVEHTPDAGVPDAGEPAGTCHSDSDCACNDDCNLEDAGYRFCGMRVVHSCLQAHDCMAHDAGGPNCLPIVRDGGQCGYSTCQP